MNIEIEKLKKEIEVLNKRIKELEEENFKLKSKKLGRKNKFSDQEREMIKMYRIQGKTLQELSLTFKCSIGLIHKIVNE